MKIIAVEEHFFTRNYVQHLVSRKDYPKFEITRDHNQSEEVRLWHSPGHYTVQEQEEWSRKLDTGEGRLREMDEHGIAMQVLSFAAALELLEPAEGAALAKATNDELAEIVAAHPDRFAGFAALAAQDPDGAAAELERAVTKLGLKGTKINAHVGREFLDEEKYRVIFETAARLGVPVYLHPMQPSPEMIKPFQAYPGLAGPIWGFAAAAGLQAIRLIYSGIFDRCPGLKIILGHLGEALPFWLWRLDNRWERDKITTHPLTKDLRKKPGEYLRDNFLVATSGMFSLPAFQCVYQELGAERIMFAVDYPNESNRQAVQFLEQLPVSHEDKEKICHLNAERLLKL
ncbi:MAG: amidohydrolase family protein [Chloroflexota bacterium]